MEGAEEVVLGRGRVVHRRVVAEQDHLHALEPHHAVGLGPAPVIADAHAEQPAEGAPDRPAEVAHVEVALLEVLEGAPRLVLRVAGQMDLPVLADEAARLVDQDRGVEAPGPAAVRDELGVAQAEADAEAPRLVEERSRLRPRHLPLEERVDLRLVLHPPAGKEGREGQLREDDEVGAAAVGLGEEGEEALDDERARLAPGNRAELRGGDGDRA